jgi:hypothetical protein
MRTPDRVRTASEELFSGPAMRCVTQSNGCAIQLHVSRIIHQSDGTLVGSAQTAMLLLLTLL